MVVMFLNHYYQLMDYHQIIHPRQRQLIVRMVQHHQIVPMAQQQMVHTMVLIPLVAAPIITVMLVLAIKFKITQSSKRNIRLLLFLCKMHKKANVK